MRRFSGIAEVFLVFILVLLIYHQGLFNFFFQDDYIHLDLGWLRSISDITKLIIPVDYFPFRPIAIQFLSFIAVHIFSLNPLPAHMLLFAIHGLNLLLLWRVLDEISCHRFEKFVIILLYGTSSIHFMLLYWWSISYMLLGTTFTLTNFLYLDKYEKKPKIKYLIFYFLTLTLMFFTNEALVVYPLFLASKAIILNKKSIKKLILPSFIFSSIFILLRLNLAKYPQSSDYHIGNLLINISTFRWYLFRAINIVEGVRSMDELISKVVFVLLALIIFLIFTIFWCHRKEFSQDSLRQFYFGLSWYLIFAGPFFFLHNHISPYFLNTALIGFFIAVSSISFSFLKNGAQRINPWYLDNSRFGQTSYTRKLIHPWVNTWSSWYCGKNAIDKSLVGLTLILYLVMSYINVAYLQSTHWVVWRADIARRYVNKIKENYPSLPKGAKIGYRQTEVSPSEIKVALSGNKALRLYYYDPSLEVFYDNGEAFEEADYGYIITD